MRSNSRVAILHTSNIVEQVARSGLLIILYCFTDQRTDIEQGKYGISNLIESLGHKVMKKATCQLHFVSSMLVGLCRKSLVPSTQKNRLSLVSKQPKQVTKKPKLGTTIPKRYYADKDEPDDDDDDDEDEDAEGKAEEPFEHLKPDQYFEWVNVDFTEMGWDYHNGYIPPIPKPTGLEDATIRLQNALDDYFPNALDIEVVPHADPSMKAHFPSTNSLSRRR